MKKIKKLLFLIFAFSETLAFGEIEKSSRFFEIGIDADSIFCQNLLQVNNLLQKEVVIDTDEIVSSLDNKGLLIDGSLDASAWLKFDLRAFTMGLEFKFENFARFNISQEIFNVVAYGNEVDVPVTATSDLTLQSFMAVEAPLKLKLNRFIIRARPAVFLPLFYMSNPSLAVTFVDNSDGSASVEAEGYADLYSIVGLNLFLDENFSYLGDQAISNLKGLLDSKELLSTLANSCGIDLALEVEYPLTKKIDITAYTRFPLHHGTLTSVSSMEGYFSAEMSAITDSFFGASSTSSSSDEESSSSSFIAKDGPYYEMASTDSTEFKINRPFRAGLSLAWRPFGSWFVLRPTAGYAIENPFGSDWSSNKTGYFEGGLGLDFDLFNVFKISFDSQYMNKIWSNSGGISINLRVLELYAYLGTSSSSFAKSLQLSGVNAQLGLKFGF